MTPEAKVKKFIKETLKKWYPDIWLYNPPGGAFGKSGMPDHLFYYKTVLIAIEAKADKGKPTALQIKQLKILAAQGAIVAIVYGNDLEKLTKIKAMIDRRVERNETMAILFSDDEAKIKHIFSERLQQLESK